MDTTQGIMAWSDTAREHLINWSESLRPIPMDIVGDFAGEELFAIHGEALVAHCIRSASVDYDYGFQLLHAVHAVESFLGKMSDHGCNFDIVWFDRYKHLCMSQDVPKSNSYKYMLTRDVIIQHLARSEGSYRSVRFNDIDDELFLLYLEQAHLHFFLCDKDGTANVNINSDALDRLSVGYRLVCKGYCLAFINDVEFVSSKVNATIVTPAQNLIYIDSHTEDNSTYFNGSLRLQRVIQVIQGHSKGTISSARDVLFLQALSRVLKEKATEQRQQQAASILLHLVLLYHLDLSQRSFPQVGAGLQEGHEVMREFSEAASNILDEWTVEDTDEMDWDVYDLVDGRLYLQVSHELTLASLPEDVVEEFTALAKLLMILSGVDVSEKLPHSICEEKTKRTEENSHGADTEVLEQAGSTSSVLPFAHPVMDKYLQQVHLETEEHREPATPSYVFRELTHWHNARKPVDPKHIPAAQGYFARRRNQRFMADTIAYSASLTGTTGKNIDPEVVVVKHSDEGGDAQTPKKPEADWKAALRSKQASKNKKQQGKSGRQKALDEAQVIKTGRAADKSVTMAASWEKSYSILDEENNMIRRYLRAEKYFRGLSSTQAPFIAEPASLYLCHILNLLREKGGLSQADVLRVTAMLWSQITETNRLPLTVDVAEQLTKLSTSLNMSVEIVPASPPKRKTLPFSIRGSSRFPAELLKPREFQLEYCGPYMERSFDSAPDARVPFSPDAWQRRVLDVIDTNKSLFIVAPTSAGKTFISFYAMKKVLQANDTDVIVYVAPTKALVNQIAAEVQARFRKAYHTNQEGHSVWAIHTRDYRVNNPAGCQILITVPHILQIMLLAPTNAKGPNSWARRIKRIIFDEVHCIGQSEDGVIWEQLLLLAPCPIIALSATVGNPDEFKTWLEGTQKVKGFGLEMITHKSRYSDLRKFIYMPPQRYDFQGLKSVERLPFPGLDSGDTIMGRFSFIHPIGGLVSRNMSALNDTALEPRDCLTLWRCLQRAGGETSSSNETLHPEHYLPDMIKKSDVVKWEQTLKQKVGALMLDSKHQFDAIQNALQPQCLSPSSGNISGDENSDDPNLSPALNSPHLALILDLRSSGALPAIVFNFDRLRCERFVLHLLNKLTLAENKYRESPEWKKKIKDFEKWGKENQKAQAKSEKQLPRHQAKDGEGLSKLDMLRDKASQEASHWQSFDPIDPLPKYNLADETKISKEELEERLKALRCQPIRSEFIDALRRGMGVHHAGMNFQYRQAVEMLFRKGYLTVVVATGTLAMGLNMPCKTVVFSGDSVFLTALQYRQASGRAGRRGFDVLGNVVFHGIPRYRVLEITSSRLPNLRGQFPTSVTLILRLFGLLHGTDNSEYACDAVRSLLSQSRLYLGGPSSKLAIEHHLRFSIDYLRRQQLLSASGVPLNFSGLVGHLYYTENAAFAFHSLLKEGYFHELCAQIDQPRRQQEILLEFVLVLSHIFCRIPCYRHADKAWLESVVHRSSSVVILPTLPVAAARILKKHNGETLRIFQNYVRTYSMQHLADSPDDKLPFTKRMVQPRGAPRDDLRSVLRSLPETTVASPFAALSGATDNFTTIGELCRDVRSGVFLEASTVPHVPLAPEETGGVPWNAYLYDFFKNGDLKALKRDNGIKEGDVWYKLKDFSLVLATIVTSLTNFLGGASIDDQDAAMVDVQDAADVYEENAVLDFSEDAEEQSRVAAEFTALNVGGTTASTKGKSRKKVVVESWDEENQNSDSMEEEADADDPSPIKGKGGQSSALDATGDADLSSWAGGRQGESLVKVFKALSLLRDDFDTKFKKTWT